MKISAFKSLAIVALAIVIDRITQAYGKPRKPPHKPGPAS